MPHPMRVIDKRNKQYFMVDDVYLNGYARILGVTASMVYISLCRHADKNQSCFPSQKQIAEELAIKERTVMDKIKVLREWGMIEISRTRSKKGRWLHNSYYLTDKSSWKEKPPTVKQQVDTTYSLTAKPPTVKQQYKDTHKKDTHNNVIYKKSENVDNSETDYYANLIATKLHDEKSLTFYKIACKRNNPKLLLEKAHQIIADGGANNPGAVFIHWLNSQK